MPNRYLITLLLGAFFAAPFIAAQTPSLQWAFTRPGYGQYQDNYRMQPDASGNILLAGKFYSTLDIDPGAGVYNVNAQGLNDFFVEKLDANGHFLWGISLGTPGYDDLAQIRLDAAGNIYLSGDFYEDMDADPGPDVSMIYAEGGISIFIISLDSAGKFRWARSIPDAGTGLIDAMAVDKSGNVYLSDQYKSGADMDPGPGVTILDSLFNVGNYLLKMDANGDFIWCKTIGQSKRFEPYLTVITRCLHAAPDESIYFTCSYMGDTLDLDPGAGVYQVTGTSDDYNGALVKINPNGDLLWACHTNSIGNYKAVTTDLNGNVYAVGDFEDWMDFDPGKGVFKLDAGYRSDSFLQKLDAEGNLIWVKNTGIDIIFNTTFLSTDMDKGVWIAGNFFNNIYCINEGQKIVLSSIGDQDIFVQYIDKQGNVKLLKNIGSAATDAIESMATDLEGNLYVSGRVDGLADIDFGGTYHTIDSNSPALFVGQWRPGQKIESKPLPLILTPNPTSGLLTLDLNAPPQDVRINIWNATGQFMSSRVYHDAALFQFELEGNPGLYFVQVVLEDGTTVVEKVVKGL